MPILIIGAFLMHRGIKQRNHLEVAIGAGLILTLGLVINSVLP